MRPDPNREALEHVAAALGELADDVVFVGGAVIGLLLTDPAAPRPRPTKDVDVIVEVASLVDDQTRLRSALVARGFSEMTAEDAPICAWKVGNVRVDIIPTDARIFGFTNEWFEEAFQKSERHQVGTAAIRVVAGPYMLATKLEAFGDRGKNDYRGSHDLEDAIALVDGRAELMGEVEASDSSVRTYLANEFSRLLASQSFLDALPGHVLDVGRDTVILKRLQVMAALG